MIRVVQGRLEDVEVEAVLRPIRSDLAPVTPASRDLAIAAGPELEERLQKLGALPVGGAVMTPGGALVADFAIHAVVMSPDEPQSALTIQKALRNGLARAADWGITSLALPPLGLGVGLTEPETAAATLLEILGAHLDEGRDPLDLVVVATSSFEEELFTTLIAAAGRDRGS